MKTKVAFFTQGCRLNQSETAVIEQSLSEETYQVVSMDQQPELVVVNTCTVTENGDADTRKLVRKINRENANAKIALIGCQSQILKEKLLELPNVQWVIGNHQKMQLPQLLKTFSLNEKKVLVEKIKREPFIIEKSGIDHAHKRANIKIQDGCDFYCSFCVIPFARGPARSRVFEDIHREVVDLVGAGHQEIVITGINVGTYEYEGKTIVDVVDSLTHIDGLKRIRISSIEPTTIADPLLERMADVAHPLCRYLHIPIQSGSEEILQAMSRKYSISEFRAFVDHAVKIVPDICIGTDVIVGFPGETKAHFDETVANLMTLPIHYYHVFSYSEREHTRAKKHYEAVPQEDIHQRSSILRKLSQKQKQAYFSRFIGQTIPVLFEQQKQGRWFGTSEHYLKVHVTSDCNLENQLRPVTLTALTEKGLQGTLA